MLAWPLQTRLGSVAQLPLGHRPLTDEQLTQVLQAVSLGFDRPGEAAVFFGTEGKAAQRGGRRAAEGPS